jgi:hypothetical protein
VRGMNEVKAIDKALLKGRNDTKEDIISDYCPNDIPFNILKPPTYCICNYDDELCTKCWNREIEEDKSELTFEQLEKSPIKRIELANSSELNLLESLNNDDFIISDNGYITYENLSQFIKWLQDVYDYTTELKRQSVYVDFYSAKEYMKNGNKAKFKELTYWIENNALYCDLYSEPKATDLSLEMIESNKWILL